MQKTQYDYSKLLGRMKEKGYTQAALAAVLGISEVTLNLALNNNRDFRQSEINTICCKDCLNINVIDIPIYFFSHKTSENGRKQGE